MQDLILITVSRHEFKELLKECINEALDKKEPEVKSTDPEKPMSLKETSEFLNLAPQTIYGYTSKNIIPFFKNGKKLYFKKKDLLNWLHQSNPQDKTNSQV